jgi:TetR/AcrR family transcriptional regulator, repressor of fatR-cypB operon
MVRLLSEEKRNTFLTAALSLFVANGVQNTSTAEIAKAAGTAAGTLFLYFPTKQDLMNELILKIGKEQSDYIQSLLRSSFSAREAFETIWRGTITWFMDHLEAYLYVQQVRDTGWIAPEVVQESSAFFGYYYDAIKKGLQEGSLKPEAFEIIGAFLYYDIVAIMNIIRTQPQTDVRENVIRMGFEIFWDGICSKEME